MRVLVKKLEGEGRQTLALTSVCLNILCIVTDFLFHPVRF